MIPSGNWPDWVGWENGPPRSDHARAQPVGLYYSVPAWVEGIADTARMIWHYDSNEKSRYAPKDESTIHMQPIVSQTGLR